MGFGGGCTHSYGWFCFVLRMQLIHTHKQKATKMIKHINKMFALRRL